MFLFVWFQDWHLSLSVPYTNSQTSHVHSLTKLFQLMYIIFHFIPQMYRGFYCYDTCIINVKYLKKKIYNLEQMLVSPTPINKVSTPVIVLILYFTGVSNLPMEQICTTDGAWACKTQDRPLLSPPWCDDMTCCDKIWNFLFMAFCLQPSFMDW
jgi:hypothetical protein